MSLRLTRRQFVGSAAAIAVAGGRLRAEPSDMPDLPMIDTHQHLWDLDRFRLAWLSEAESLRRNYLPSDYAEATAGLNVVKTVYMEVDVDPEQQQAEADYVLQLCRDDDNPMAGAVISGRPASAGFAAYVRQYRDEPYIKGVRQVLQGSGTPPGYCLEKEFVAGIRLLGKLGKSFDICMRAAELPDAAKLIDACPDTRFVLDHCGNAEVQTTNLATWRRDMEEVARRPNVIGKVSGIVASAKPGAWTADDLAPFVNHTLEVFGPDRVVFGGDWPVCTLAATYRQWVEALRQIVADRDLIERRKLFHDNAEAFYGLG